MSLFTRTFSYAVCLLLARSTNHKNLTSVVNVRFDRRTICDARLRDKSRKGTFFTRFEYIRDSPTPRQSGITAYYTTLTGRLHGRLRLYCSMTYEDLTFTRDFNMPARVRLHVNQPSVRKNARK